jgi:hypothetical protein
MTHLDLYRGLPSSLHLVVGFCTPPLLFRMEHLLEEWVWAEDSLQLADDLGGGDASWLVDGWEKE